MRPAGVLDRDHEPLYGEALIVELDTVTGRLTRRMSWRTPEFAGAGHCFKGASWDDDLLLVCSEREILEIDPEGWRVVRRWTHPWFNDVHHVARIDGRLHAVSTGLDALLVLDDAGEVRDAHAMGTRPLRAQVGVDYRAVSTKPHEVHPNHVFAFDGRAWVTRCLASDARVVAGTDTLAVGGGLVHDGHVAGDAVWFTTVDGELVALSRAGRRRVRLDGGASGWCRGLWVNEDTAWVGFSRLRATRWRSGLARVRAVLRGRPRARGSPTRVSAHELSTGREVARFITEDVGLHAVFAVLPRRRR